jgi:UDP-glucose 4-epimerase
MPRYKSVLITGGAGFIGSHVADRLLAEGSRVVALDNLAVGRLGNIGHLGTNPAFTLILGDVVDRELVIRIVKEFGVDAVIHLAAVHYIPFCNAHPYDAFRINVLGTQSVADAAVAGGVGKIVLASTSDVYATKDLPFVEDDPLDPYTVYGTTKFTAERLLRLMALMHEGLSVSIARLFNVYGPRETNPHVLPEILDQLKSERPAIRLGNLWPRRAFVCVTDVAGALVALLSVTGRCDAFNVGSGVATVIGDAAKIIATLADRRMEVGVDPDRVRPVERGCLHADITKITNLVPWRPTETFETGMLKWLAAEGIVPAVRA